MQLAASRTPLSIHVAETPFESQLTRDGSGPIADFYRANGVPIEPTGKSVLRSLEDLNLVRGTTQLVHCCAVDEDDIQVIKNRNAYVAHCPRSNKRLQCPPAPIREILDSGIDVGLGLDSAASSGPIDMFAEMRSALETGIERNKPLTAQEVWRMATAKPHLAIDDYYRSKIDKGSEPRLIKIHIQDAHDTGDIIEQAHPGLVEWI